MRLTYLGHSAVQVETSEHNLLFDPYLTGNPLATVSAQEVAPDYIFLTHAHGDHLGDSEEIAKRSGATVVALVEICNKLSANGVATHGMNMGGWFPFPFGRLRFTPAWHSSSFPDGSYGGMPAGIVVEAGGRRIYHAGDTALFGDMHLIGALGLDLALLPIGANFTMGPEEAAQASRLLGAKRVVPIHYNTFGLIEQDPGQFKRLVESQGSGECLILEPGQSIEL